MRALIQLVALVGLCIVGPCGRPAEANLRLQSVPLRAPQRFTDAILPDGQRTGQAVENLGQVMLLNTFMSPKSTDTMSTKFNIFNRRKSMKGIRFSPKLFCTLGEFNRTHGPYEYNLDLMLQSSFNIESRTIVMVPGYLSEAEEPWIRAARESWLELEDVNVIEVSWSDSNRGIYSTAVAHTPLVARQITIFLYYLAELSEKRLHDDDFLGRLHLIGHSLGAHIVGFVGQDLDGRAGRITGLDPAGPSFDQFAPNQRLDRRDARLVEIYHTNRGKMRYMNAVASAPLHAIGMLPGISTMAKALSSSYSGEGDTAWYGIDINIGHIDYYANNGRVQPGCSGILHICDHNRATDIYVEMLRHERQLRKYTDETELLRQSRLLAFRADGYDDFVTGTAFNKHCPAINEGQWHLGAQVDKTIRRCSVPMDLVSPAEELIGELESDYGIDFSYSSPSATTYYFKTLDEGNLVGDHYLLKIYIKLTGETEMCAVKVNIEMPRGEKIELELDKVVEDHETNELPIAVPFVHPGGPAARAKLNKILRQLNGDEGGQTANGTVGADQMRDLLPHDIELNLVRPKSKSLFGTVKDLTIKMLKLDAAQLCSFDVDLVEVHSIGGVARNFAGIYYSTAKEAADDKLKTFSVDDLEEFRAKGFTIGTLGSETPNFRVALSAIALG